MGTDVADHDVVRIQCLSKVPDDPLGLHREARIACERFELFHDGLAERRYGRALRGGRLRSDGWKRERDVSDYPHLENVVRVDLGRRGVHVDDLAIARRMPRAGVILDHVVANADDDVCPVEAAAHVVVRLQPHAPEGERMREGNHALRHEGRGDRDVQPFRKSH